MPPKTKALKKKSDGWTQTKLNFGPSPKTDALKRTPSGLKQSKLNTAPPSSTTITRHVPPRINFVNDTDEGDFEITGTTAPVAASSSSASAPAHDDTLLLADLNSDERLAETFRSLLDDAVPASTTIVEARYLDFTLVDANKQAYTPPPTFSDRFDAVFDKVSKTECLNIYRPVLRDDNRKTWRDRMLSCFPEELVELLCADQAPSASQLCWSLQDAFGNKAYGGYLKVAQVVCDGELPAELADDDDLRPVVYGGSATGKDGIDGRCTGHVRADRKGHVLDRFAQRLKILREKAAELDAKFPGQGFHVLVEFKLAYTVPTPYAPPTADNLAQWWAARVTSLIFEAVVITWLNLYRDSNGSNCKNGAVWDETDHDYMPANTHSPLVQSFQTAFASTSGSTSLTSADVTAAQRLIAAIAAETLAERKRLRHYKCWLLNRARLERDPEFRARVRRGQREYMRRERAKRYADEEEHVLFLQQERQAEADKRAKTSKADAEAHRKHTLEINKASAARREAEQPREVVEARKAMEAAKSEYFSSVASADRSSASITSEKFDKLRDMALKAHHAWTRLQEQLSRANMKLKPRRWDLLNHFGVRYDDQSTRIERVYEKESKTRDRVAALAKKLNIDITFKD